jgi:hypothetical protein
MKNFPYLSHSKKPLIMTLSYKTKKILIEIVGSAIVYGLFAFMTTILFLTIGGIGFGIYKLITIL